MRIVDQKVASFSAYLAVAVTVVVSPWSNFDPINLAKVLVLSVGSFGIAGIVASKKKEFFQEFKNRSLFSTLLFPFFLLATFFLSNGNLVQQFWGIFGRNNGLLSYFALYLLFISVAVNSGKFIERPLILALKSANLFVLAYALIQWSGNDPIGWSQKGMFATLGNVNFASAFLALSAVSWIGSLLLDKSSLVFRTSILGLLALEFVVLLKMDSIQGPVMFVVAFALLTFLRIRKSITSGLFLAFSVVLAVAIFVLGSFGVAGKGPLARFVFQNSNVFRADYMGAALRMMREKPLFGVGLDAYDYWYRNFRGFISAYRTGINRSSNSAHNIFLDIGAGGGVPLLLSYIVIVLLALVSFLKIVRNHRSASSESLAIACAWLVYQVQSLISINQIGVGVWGWLLSGSIISLSSQMSLQDKDNLESKKVKRNELRYAKNAALPPRSLIFAVVAGIIGLLLALPPVSADAKFRKSMTNADLATLLKSDQTLGLSSFHMEKSLEVIVGRGMNSEALSLAERIVKKFPRSMYSWQVIASTSQDGNMKQAALAQISRLDPWLACLNPDPSATIRAWFVALPDSKKIELLRWWGLLPERSSASDRALLGSVPPISLSEKLASFCGR